VRGGALVFIGFLLSPLSWWNDLFVNVPLAVGFGWLAALVWPPAFEAVVVVGYWLTNVLGLVLLHRGARDALAREQTAQPYSRRDFRRDLLTSLGYTLLIGVLLKLKIIQPLAGYFRGE
jgi:hypothetical protein